MLLNPLWNYQFSVLWLFIVWQNVAKCFKNFVCYMYVTIVTQGSKKGLYDHPGQVDFLAGQVTLHSHALHKQGPRCVIYQLNHSKTKLRLARGKKSLRAAGLKGKLEFNFFFPEADNQVVNLNLKKTILSSACNKLGGNKILQSESVSKMYQCCQKITFII